MSLSRILELRLSPSFTPSTRRPRGKRTIQVRYAFENFSPLAYFCKFSKFLSRVRMTSACV